MLNLGRLGFENIGKNKVHMNNSESTVGQIGMSVRNMLSIISVTLYEVKENQLQKLTAHLADNCFGGRWQLSLLMLDMIVSCPDKVI